MSAAPTNGLLDQLTDTYRETLLSKMEEITLNSGDPIYSPGTAPRYAHFVTMGIISVVDFMSDGAGVEVALVGREGLAESIQLLGTVSGPTTAFVQVAGSALRMPFAEMKKQFAENSEMRTAVLRYVQAQSFSAMQTAACNRLHEVEPRMARWLLMVCDRMGISTFGLTQEFIAQMLGANRTTVTLAAQRLQEAGLIEYSRGKVTILNAKALQMAACECYPIVKRLLKEGSAPS